MGVLVMAGMLGGACTADDVPQTTQEQLDGGPGGSAGGIQPPPPKG